MLDSVRNNLLSGWSLVIIISICALPFVFLGTGSLGTVFGSNFGSVNGEKIEEIDIQIAQSRVTQNYREIFGDDFDFSVLSEEQLTEEINNEIIRQKVILAEVRSLGLLNKEEIRNSKKEILKNQDFYIDGQFDEGRFEAFVNANGFTKDDFIEMLTRMESSNRYLQTITSNFVTNHEIKSFIELIEKTVDIDFIKIQKGCSRVLDIDVDDTADILINFQNGVNGHVHVDFLQKPRVHQLKIVTSLGRFEWDCHKNTLYFIGINGNKEDYSDTDIQRNDMFISMMKNFVNDVQSGRSSGFTVSDAITELQLLLNEK